MADQIEKNGQAVNAEAGSGPDNTGTTEPQKQGVTLDKLPQELIDQISSRVEEKFKAEISSRDKKISEYQKTIKEKELEGKTEKEKAELLAKQKEEELQMKAAELEIAQANFLKTKMVAEEKLDPSAIELITGKSEDEIKASVKKIKDFWSKASQAGVDSVLKASNTEPRKSNASTVTGPESIKAQISEAKKSGDMPKALKLQGQLNEMEKNKN